MDCAFKNLQMNDYIVLQLWGKKGANCYLIDQVRDRIGIRAKMDTIRNFSLKYPKAYTKIIKSKTNSSTVVEMLKMEIGGIIPYSPKESEESGMYSGDPNVEAGNIFLLIVLLLIGYMIF